MIRISNIKIREQLDLEELIKVICLKYKLDNTKIKSYKIHKKSIDARNKEDVHYVYTVDLSLVNETNIKIGEKIKEIEYPVINKNYIPKKPPVIIGAGPAGLFAALTLVENGIKPIIIEQGKTIDERKKDVDKFHNEGILNPLSNVQFGEGGAGTFSDGKLTTQINNIYYSKVIDEFIENGSPIEIGYLSKPHIGTDNLIKVIKNIREKIKSMGGIFLFETKVIDFTIKDSKLKGIEYISNNKIESIETDYVILAIRA